MGVMDLLSSGANLLTGGALGGVAGLIGTAVTHRQERIAAQDKRQHNLALLEHERSLMVLEIKGSERVATINAEGAANVADAQLMAASYATEPKRYGSGSSWGTRVLLDVLDVARGALRIYLTVYLVWYLTQIMAAATTSPEMRSQIAATFVFLATTCVTWWFGTRAKKAQ